MNGTVPAKERDMLSSATKGRCRSNSFSVGGRHIRSMGYVHAMWPGTDTHLRVRRNELGEITSLDKDGELFTLQHVKDADALKRLFKEQGIDWDGRGVREIIGRKTVGDVLLDTEALSGNYPTDMPTSSRKEIGRLLTRFKNAPGVGAKELREARTALIHEAWKNGWKPLNVNDSRRTLLQTWPGLAICELPEALYPVLREGWEHDCNSYDQYVRHLAQVSDKPLNRRLAMVLEEVFYDTGVSARQAGGDGKAVISFEEFTRLLIKFEIRDNKSRYVGLKLPDGSTVTGVSSLRGVKHLGRRVGKDIGIMAQSMTKLARELAPAKQTKETTWCHRCGVDCTCTKGQELINELTVSWQRTVKYADDEHRWGTERSIKPSARLQRQARAMAPSVEARLTELLGEETHQTWVGDYGEQIHENLALFLTQIDATAEELTNEFLKDVIKVELDSVKYRAGAIHAGWIDRIRELEELGTAEEKLAVFLGRDGIYGYWAFQEMEKLGVVDTNKVKAVYVSASRGVNTPSMAKLRRLSETGEDLIYVDTGFEGTIPRNLHEAVYEKPVTGENSVTSDADGARLSARRGGLKEPHTRLVSSNHEAKTFFENVEHNRALQMEHDAKEHYTSRAVVIGKDGGEPVGALEQFVSRHLQEALRTQARHEAQNLQPIGDSIRARYYYVEEAITRMTEKGLTYNDIVNAGRKGLGAGEAIAAHKIEGDMKQMVGV